MIKRKGTNIYLKYLRRRKEKIERANRKRRNRKKRFLYQKGLYRNEEVKKPKKVVKNIQLQLVREKLDRSNFDVENFSLKSSRDFTVPENFSFFDEPNMVIDLIKGVYSAGKNKRINKITISHNQCNNLGLDASVFMDIIVLAIINYRKKINASFEILGDFVEDGETKDILLASGLPTHLGLKLDVNYDKSKVRKFNMVSGINSPEDKKSDLIATRLTEYFDRCLRTQWMSINNEGKMLLSVILGEVINNSIIHGGESSTWYTQGHYQMKNGNEYGEMQLVFLNIGDTIYEGLLKESSNETKEVLEIINKKHRPLYSESWNQEMLYTVFSLQEGISRLKDKNIEGYGSRGTGTINLIEMFYAIGETASGLHPRMTLTSGHTHIIFNERYQLSNVSFDNDPIFDSKPKRILAFNKENDIYSQPDRENVIRLKEYFPGTIISLRFYLDNRYIQEIQKGKVK